MEVWDERAGPFARTLIFINVFPACQGVFSGMTEHATHPVIPGSGQSFESMPGHWVLAQMGKRVLRPGGMELTRQLLQQLGISSSDDVLEFAPGLGATARITLSNRPASYTAVERNPDAAAHIRKIIGGAEKYRCIQGSAESTGLEGASLDVVYGEAMLTMQSHAMKSAIIGEASRILRPKGRYGIHEIAFVPEAVSETVKREVLHALSGGIRVGARPQTVPEWTALMQANGFRVVSVRLAPLHLLERKRIIKDEGFFRTLRFLFNVLRTPKARKRVLEMRAIFRRYATNLQAVMIVAEKI